MNILSLLSASEIKGDIRIGDDIWCNVVNGCPNLQCTKKHNLKRAVYHSVRAINFTYNGIEIDIAPFYEETKPFNLRDLIMLSNVADIQINDTNETHRICGDIGAIELFINKDNEILYRNVKSFNIIAGSLIVTLAPSVDDIINMIMK